MTTTESPLGAPLEVASVVLRNRFVATAHASGHTRNGLPVDGDAEYWKRVGDGGAAMLISGGTAPALESTPRRRNLVECWRPEVVDGWGRRVDAIHAGGALAISQFVHLGRETLGSETWFSPVAPSAVRSPREPTTPRPLTDGEIDAIVEGHHASAKNAFDAGFDGVELHAAHGYLLSQFLSPATNLRDTNVDGRVALTQRILRTMRDAAPGRLLGVRLSLGGEHEAGLDLDGLCAVLERVADIVDYVNVTVGVRNTYVRDMGTEHPPLLDHIARLRAQVTVPMVASQAFRDQADMEAALAAGADLIGMARPYIADPELPNKLLSGRAAQVRPCVSCNEDCRVFDPCLLCSVNPDLAPPGSEHRPAMPLRIAAAAAAPSRVAVVGAGPAGLECALRLARAGTAVTVFEAAAQIGGQLAIATAAPHRHGWARLLAFYASELERHGAEVLVGQGADAEALAPFDEVVVAVGAEEDRPPVPGADHAWRSWDLLVAGPAALKGVQRLVVVDDGWGWWPCVSAVEVGVAAGVGEVTVASPSTAFAGAIPAESRVQFLGRLGDVRLQVLALQRLDAVDAGGVDLRGVPGGAASRVDADAVVLVGERRARSWPWLPDRPGVQAVGDCLVPRRVQHAVSEGCAAAEAIVAARRPVAVLN